MIKSGKYLIEEYKFNEEEISILFEYLDYSLESFNKYGFIFEQMNLISYTGEDSIFISTRGLVTKDFNKNQFLLAYKSQAKTFELILEEAIELLSKEDIYFVGSNNYEQLSSLSISLLHNYVFYLEIYLKAYLSLSKVPFDYTHDLEALLQLVEETIQKLNQTNSMFHLKINSTINQMVSITQKFNKNGKLNSIQSSLKYGEFNSDYLMKLDLDLFQDLYQSIQEDQSLIDYYHLDFKNDFFKGYK